MSSKSKDVSGPARKSSKDGDEEEIVVTSSPDPSKGEVEEGTGKVMDADGNVPADARGVQVEGTNLNEPVEPPESVIIPLPERPKLGTGGVSTRQLNPGMLPDGASFPKEPVAKTDIRAAIRKGQQERKDKSE